MKIIDSIGYVLVKWVRLYKVYVFLFLFLN